MPLDVLAWIRLTNTIESRTPSRAAISPFLEAELLTTANREPLLVVSGLPKMVYRYGLKSAQAVESTRQVSLQRAAIEAQPLTPANATTAGEAAVAANNRVVLEWTRPVDRPSHAGEELTGVALNDRATMLR